MPNAFPQGPPDADGRSGIRWIVVTLLFFAVTGFTDHDKFFVRF